VNAVLPALPAKHTELAGEQAFCVAPSVPEPPYNALTLYVPPGKPVKLNVATPETSGWVCDDWDVPLPGTERITDPVGVPALELTVTLICVAPG
jgi:hypothetical protein